MLHIPLTIHQFKEVAELDNNLIANVNNARYLNIYIHELPMPGFNFVQTYHMGKTNTGHIYYVDDALIARLSMNNVKQLLKEERIYIQEMYLDLLIKNVNTNMFLMLIKVRGLKPNGTNNTKQGARKTPPRHAVKSVPHRW